MAIATKLLIPIFILLKWSQAQNCTCVGYYDCYDEEYMPHKFHITLEDLGETECENPHHVCCTTLDPPLEPPDGSCGLHNTAAFKWSSQLLIKRDPYVMPTYKCGISFIHEKVAITTSFCVQEKGEYLVKVGTSIRNITKIHKHPKFNASTFRNDVAILILEKPFNISEISIICIPPQELNLAGSECIMAPKSKSRKRNLDVMAVPLIKTDDCVQRFRNTSYDIYVASAGVLCVEDIGEKGYCGEDAGGPLFCPFEGRYQQVGLGAWSIGCSENVPRVYVNLMQVRDWIYYFLDKNGFKDSLEEKCEDDDA